MYFKAIDILPHYNPLPEFNHVNILIMLGVIVFILFLGSFIKKAKVNLRQEESYLLDTYIFREPSEYGNPRKLSNFSKIVLWVMVFILIVTPMSELIRIDYYPFW